MASHVHNSLVKRPRRSPTWMHCFYVLHAAVTIHAVHPELPSVALGREVRASPSAPPQPPTRWSKPGGDPGGRKAARKLPPGGRYWASPKATGGNALQIQSWRTFVQSLRDAGARFSLTARIVATCKHLAPIFPQYMESQSTRLGWLTLTETDPGGWSV